MSEQESGQASGQVSEQEKESIENALKCLEMDMLDNTQIELLLNYIGELRKENEHLRDIKSKAIRHINCCKTSLGNYVLSPSEVECLLDILKESDIDE